MFLFHTISLEFSNIASFVLQTEINKSKFITHENFRKVFPRSGNNIMELLTDDDV